MSDERIPYVAVCGTGESDAGTDHIAEEVGRLLAERGAILVCGGLGGVMAAACRGADSAGGLSVGILPGEERAHANEFLDIVLPTGMGEMRNALIVRSVDAVIAIGGGFGTLSEIAFALKLGRPVFGLSTWELDRERSGDGGIVPVATAEEAVRMAVEPY